MDVSTASPTLRKIGGLCPWPTPWGLPVKMMSPGRSSHTLEMYDTSSPTPKFMSLVLESWYKTPFTSHVISSESGVAISSMVVSHGPIGEKFS